MRSRKILVVAVAACSALVAPAHGQTTRPAPVVPLLPIATVRLDTVAVRAQGRILILRTPGKAKGLRDAYSGSLRPGRQLAVWHSNPDSTRTYLIRAIRVRLGARMPETPADILRERRTFSEGRLALRLSAATATGSPAETNLLLVPLLLTPALASQHAKGWVRFDLSAQHLVLAPAGVFVVAKGLPTLDSEQLVRTRRLAHKPAGTTPPDDVVLPVRGQKPIPFFQYEEIQPAGSPPVRLVALADFPAIGHHTTGPGARPHSWQYLGLDNKPGRWFANADLDAQYHAANPTHKPIFDYDYDLELEVEEYQP